MYTEMLSKKLLLKFKRLWYIWCQTMGDKISDNSRDADIAALIRTFWWIVNIVTCFFIIANVIRHW